MPEILANLKKNIFFIYIYIYIYIYFILCITLKYSIAYHVVPDQNGEDFIVHVCLNLFTLHEKETLWRLVKTKALADMK